VNAFQEKERMIKQMRLLLCNVFNGLVTVRFVNKMELWRNGVRFLRLGESEKNDAKHEFQVLPKAQSHASIAPRALARSVPYAVLSNAVRMMKPTAHSSRSRLNPAPTPPLEIRPPTHVMRTKKTNLEKWLGDPRATEFFGRAFSVKADVLFHLVSGRDTLPAIAARYSVSRQAIHKHVKRARLLFGL
jgi:hypothetical protein